MCACVQGLKCIMIIIIIKELTLMDFTPEEVTAAKAEVDESHSQLSQGSCGGEAAAGDMGTDGSGGQRGLV